MFMTIQSNVKDKILVTPSETSKVENAPTEMLRDLDQQMEKRADDDAGESVSDAIRFNYQLSIRCAPFEALYGRKCRSLVLWAEIGENSLIGLELVQETINKVVLIKEKLKAARDRQKSCADNRRKPLEFEGKLAPRYVGPFEVLKRIGTAKTNTILGGITSLTTLLYIPSKPFTYLQNPSPTFSRRHPPPATVSHIWPSPSSLQLPVYHLPVFALAKLVRF
ncbi:hypothetical protein Tco_1309046 [Tanacetum coccineum]